MVLRKLCCLVLCAAAAALSPYWLALLPVLRPLVLEPPGVASALRALPRRGISDAEREQFQREGVLLLRGLVRDARLLDVLREALLEHASFDSTEYPAPYQFNGAVRALLRDGPIFPALAELFQAPAVHMDECPIWGGERAALSFSSWHQDNGAREDFVTLWLTLTEAPHALEFFRGSHLAAAGMLQACNRSWQLGKPGERLVDGGCALQFSRERLDPALGRPSFVWEDFRPGDAVLFDGRTLHRGVLWTRERVAFSVRGHPIRMGFGHFCGTYPWTDATLGATLGCKPEELLPRPRWLWPDLQIALPSGDTASGRASRRAVAAVTQAAYGHSGSLRAALRWLQGTQD